LRFRRRAETSVKNVLLRFKRSEKDVFGLFAELFSASDRTRERLRTAKKFFYGKIGTNG